MVTHRNILPFIGYQIVDEVAMLVSPWCKNGNLATYIAAHPKLVRNDKLRLVSSFVSTTASRLLVLIDSLDDRK